jgi:hypothetical protein
LYEYQKKLTEMFAGLTKAQRVKTANIANVLKGNHVAMADIARRVTQTQQMFVNSSLLTVARHIDEVRTVFERLAESSKYAARFQRLVVERSAAGRTTKNRLPAQA